MILLARACGEIGGGELGEVEAGICITTMFAPPPVYYSTFIFATAIAHRIYHVTSANTPDRRNTFRKMPIQSATRHATTALSPLVLACLASTWLIWGSTYLVIRFALTGFSPFFMMGTRFICAGVALFAWQLTRGASVPTVRQWRNGLIVGTLMLGGGMGGAAYAEQTIASGLVVAFIAVVPMQLVAINWAFGARPSHMELLAVSVGFVGVLMLTRGNGLHSSPHGLLAVAIGTSCWALGSVLSQRSLPLAPGASGFASELLCGGIAMLAISALAGESWHRVITPGAWLAWSYLVVFGTLIAFNAYMLLLARTSAALAASYALVNPVVALLLGVTLGGELVSAWEWLASAVVMLGVILLFVGRRQRVAPD
jgi:drug/metabolite transporter (DMT)-like permease